MSEPPVTELKVVRHGETQWNAQGRMQGHLDSPLSPTGQLQAQAIAATFKGKPVDALYSSDLGRAHHTAQHVADVTGCQIVTDADLRERHLGVFQGLTIAEAQQQYPQVYQQFDSRDPDHVIPQGQSARQHHDRVVASAQHIAARHAGQRVVMVVHGGSLGRLLRHTLNIDLAAPRRFKIFNASINTFYVDNQVWTLGAWGDIHHLADIGTMDDA